MFKKFLNNARGMTLVELLAVIVILGIVAGIAVPSVMNIIQKSKVNAVKADAIQVLSAAKTYVASNPEVTSITESDLSDYISNSKLATGYTVAVSDNGKTFKLTANSSSTALTGVSIKFSGATSSGISANEVYKGDTNNLITISN